MIDSGPDNKKRKLSGQSQQEPLQVRVCNLVWEFIHIAKSSTSLCQKAVSL